MYHLNVKAFLNYISFSQMVLVNPLCIVAYMVASWKFFKTRVEEEEVTLLNFFGEDYVQYQKRTCTGLPFIRGFRVELWWPPAEEWLKNTSIKIVVKAVSATMLASFWAERSSFGQRLERPCVASHPCQSSSPLPSTKGKKGQTSARQYLTW